MIVDLGLPDHHRDCSTKYRLAVSVPMGASRQRGGSSTRMSTTTSTNRERAPLLLMFGSLADRMADICAHDQA